MLFINLAVPRKYSLCFFSSFLILHRTCCLLVIYFYLNFFSAFLLSSLTLSRICFHPEFSNCIHSLRFFLIFRIAFLDSTTAQPFQSSFLSQYHYFSHALSLFHSNSLSFAIVAFSLSLFSFSCFSYYRALYDQLTRISKTLSFSILLTSSHFPASFTSSPKHIKFYEYAWHKKRCAPMSTRCYFFPSLILYLSCFIFFVFIFPHLFFFSSLVFFFVIYYILNFSESFPKYKHSVLLFFSSLKLYLNCFSSFFLSLVFFFSLLNSLFLPRD